jgi:hypothetical protein
MCFLAKTFKITLSICSWGKTHFPSKLCVPYIVCIDKNPAILLIFQYSGNNSHLKTMKVFYDENGINKPIRISHGIFIRYKHEADNSTQKIPVQPD